MLNSEIIKSNLVYDGNVTVLDSVDSTNNYAKSNTKKCGDVFLTKNQTRGKGRLGRSWVCSDSLAMSVALKPFESPEENLLIPLFAGYAVVNAIYELTGLKSMIKWPNDVVYDGKKLCGILTEAVSKNGKIETVVCGIGINTGRETFEQNLSDKAITLESVVSTEFDESLLAAKICNGIFGLLDGEPKLPDNFNDYVVNINKEVYIIKNNAKIRGYAKKVCSNGGLLVEYPDGTNDIITAGEVSVRGIYGYI